jgi:hypothetical protein
VSIASLLTATLYQGNPDRNHRLWNIVSNYILFHMQVLLKDTSDTVSASYLDLHLEIDSKGHLRTKLTTKEIIQFFNCELSSSTEIYNKVMMATIKLLK